MIVICPKCQFENNAETSHVVCARCATLIEVSNTQEASPAAGWGTVEMPPRITKPMSSLPVGGPQRRDSYATRIEPEADEVLDIPRVSNGVYPIAESGAVFDEVLSAAPPPVTPVVPVMPRTEETPRMDSFSTAPDEDLIEFPPAPTVASPFTSAEPDPILMEPESPPASSADWPEMPAQNGACAQNGGYEANHNDWPMLPEDSFSAQHSADSPHFNSGGSRRYFVPVLLILVVFGGLAGTAWYLFRDKFSKQNQIAQKINNPPNGQTAKPTGSAAAPSISPGAATGSAAVKPGSENNAKAASSPATSPSAGPAETVGAKPPAPSPGAAASKSPLPVPVSQTGPTGQTGQSVNRNEGGLTLQLGSYNNQNEAGQRVAALKSAGVEARVVRAEIPGKGTWYRVQTGRFTSREEASRYASQLKARGLIRDFMVTGYQAN
ncbi:MAG TPA: SPOR domain-containing protein [Blastocatellia bacterium]|nr:SPOR domain-containing protein [Blastocatellia bacterium]